MKKKILLISCIFILLIFTLINNCFAFSDYFEYDDTVYTLVLPDNVYNTLITLDEYNDPNYSYVVTCLQRGRVSHVYFVHKDIDQKLNISLEHHCFQSNHWGLSNYSTIYYQINGDTGEIISKDTNHTDFQNTFSFIDNTFYCYTNMTIYTDKTYSEIFFDGSVQNEKPLGLVLKASNPNKVFKDLMKNVIPCLLICLVSFLAFRKGWSFLKGETKKA